MNLVHDSGVNSPQWTAWHFGCHNKSCHLICQSHLEVSLPLSANYMHFWANVGVSSQPASQRSSIRCIPHAKNGTMSIFSRIPDQLLCRVQVTGLVLDFWEQAASWTEDTDLATVSVIVPVSYRTLMPLPSSLPASMGFSSPPDLLGAFLLCRKTLSLDSLLCLAFNLQRNLPTFWSSL